MQAKCFLVVILFCISTNIPIFAAGDTVSVHFAFNEGKLTEAARQQLDKDIYNGSISEKLPMQIIGYADEVGGGTYNLRLSKQRAASVKTYLIQSGFRAESITLLTGKGEAGAHPQRGPDGNPADRRVDIVKVAAQPSESAQRIVDVKPPDGPPQQVSAAAIRTATVGELLTLDNIYFQPGLAIMRPESCDALDALFDALRSVPNVRIRIEGHVCCPFLAGTALDAANSMRLSVDRAKAIYHFLVERGIAADRLEYAGFSSKKPRVSPEVSEADMAMNRRVEIRVIK